MYESIRNVPCLARLPVRTTASAGPGSLAAVLLAEGASPEVLVLRVSPLWKGTALMSKPLSTQVRDLEDRLGHESDNVRALRRRVETEVANAHKLQAEIDRLTGDNERQRVTIQDYQNQMREHAALQARRIGWWSTSDRRAGDDLVASLKCEIEYEREVKNNVSTELTLLRGEFAKLKDILRIYNSLPGGEHLDSEVQAAQRRLVTEYNNKLWGESDQQVNNGCSPD